MNHNINIKWKHCPHENCDSRFKLNSNLKTHLKYTHDQRCFISKQLPHRKEYKSIVFNPFINITINPYYRNNWMFNKDIIDFITSPLINSFDVLNIDGEILAFKC